MPAETFAPLRARTLSVGPTYVELTGWQGKGPMWLILYQTGATDGLVWVSTETSHGSANVIGSVADRRPLRPPASFYVAPYTKVFIAAEDGESASDIVIEFAPHPVQPVRESLPTLEPAACER